MSPIPKPVRTETQPHSNEGHAQTNQNQLPPPYPLAHLNLTLFAITAGTTNEQQESNLHSNLRHRQILVRRPDTALGG